MTRGKEHDKGMGVFIMVRVRGIGNEGATGKNVHIKEEEGQPYHNRRRGG